MQIELTREQIEYVLACIAERPLRESFLVWTAIQQQAQAQAMQAQPAEKPPDE